MLPFIFNPDDRLVVSDKHSSFGCPSSGTMGEGVIVHVDVCVSFDVGVSVCIEINCVGETFVAVTVVGNKVSVGVAEVGDIGSVGEGEVSSGVKVLPTGSG